MGNLHKNNQLILEFLKGPFLVLHFSYYTLMTFLMMLSVILLFMLTILLSPLNATRHLICGIISIAKTASKKTRTLIRSMKFFSPEVALHLY